jgi:glycosyltransferase involved in cell wall biosynthesis
VKVALAHDYLTQCGGAERVALAMTRAFPGAPLYTSVYDAPQTYSGFADVDVRTSFLQRFPVLRKDPRRALPGLGRAWDSTHVEPADVVIASSAGWAHGIPTPEGAWKIVYCHNPARWLYQPEEYATGLVGRTMLRTLWPRLIAWDKAAAATADLYLANSAIVAKRIERAYGIEAEVLHPPISMDIEAPRRPVPGLEPGFWLTIARGRGYKNTHVVVEATRSTGARLVVAGARERWDDEPHVTSVGVVPDEQLRWLYANARALVSVSYEDFGLTPLEANVFGTPVAVLRGGGFLDSTREGVSGVFIDEASPGAVRAALRDFPSHDAARVRAHAERFSEASFRSRLQSLAQSAFAYS